MKILHIITTCDVGGAEMHILSQVRGQVARGHEVRVAYLLGQGTLNPDFLEAGASWVGLVGKGPGALWRLRTHLRWSELVHTHLLRADFMGALAATFWGRRRALISGKHNDERALLNPKVARLHGWIGRLPVRTIALSKHVAGFVQEHGRLTGKGLVCIHYGIDPLPFMGAFAERAEGYKRLRAEFGFGERDVVFVCVARLAEQKAHDVLLQAFAQAKQAWSDPSRDLRLLIVGDDPFADGMAKTTAWAADLDLLEDRSVVLTGIRRDVPAILGASDVFVMASRWEGLGLVFLEAMAANLCVLSTQVSAIPEVVEHGKTGELVPVDDAQSLGQAMTRLAADDKLRASYGARGLLRVQEHFTLEAMVDSTLAVYEEVRTQTRS
ncbi:MAG: glycosyltransferase involved in cell wall biosynthesis [Planctomycetota bacterium]